MCYILHMNTASKMKKKRGHTISEMMKVVVQACTSILAVLNENVKTIDSFIGKTDSCV